MQMWRGIALLLVLTSCTTPKLPVTLVREGFTIRLPESTVLEKRPSAGDFDLYQAKVGKGQASVGIYVGSHPNVDGFTPVEPSEPVGPDAMAKNPLIFQHPDGVEYLWTTKCEWPRYLHIWAQGRRGDMEIARLIVASVRPAKKCVQ